MYTTKKLTNQDRTNSKESTIPNTTELNSEKSKEHLWCRREKDLVTDTRNHQGEWSSLDEKA